MTAYIIARIVAWMYDYDIHTVSEKTKAVMVAVSCMSLAVEISFFIAFVLIPLIGWLMKKGGVE